MEAPSYGYNILEIGLREAETVLIHLHICFHFSWTVPQSCQDRSDLLLDRAPVLPGPVTTSPKGSDLFRTSRTAAFKNCLD